jgi:IS1 family transposase
MFIMNKLSTQKRVQILSALVEGNSLRSATRMAGVSINTVTKLLVDAGRACARYQYEVLRNLPCKRLQLDEIWSFCYAKQKNVPVEKQGILGFGNVWTWTAICAETKLVPSWLVGARDLEHATAFVQDLSERLSGRVQITSDGHRAYLQAVETAFGGNVDYAMLIKLYGPEGTKESPEARYSPGECCGTKSQPISGNPDPAHISTSYAERQNLTMRMRMRRFTRLTNAFSKKLENLEHAVALHFFHYNFIRRHQSLRVTPAMAAGVTNHLWSLEELVELIDRYSEDSN